MELPSSVPLQKPSVLLWQRELLSTQSPRHLRSIDMTIQRLAIVGDGIIGSTLAFEASLRGLEVTRFARATNGPASSAAGGMLTPAMEADLTSSALFELARLSRELYPSWIEMVERLSGRKTGYRQSGTLEVALHRDHLSELEQLEAHQARLDSQPSDSRHRKFSSGNPNSLTACRALLAENDHCVEPRRLLESLEAILTLRGVQRLDVIHCSSSR